MNRNIQDRKMQEKMRSKISAGRSATQAVSAVARNYTDAFLALEDPYIRERATDIRDVAQRLLKHLQEESSPSDGPEFREPTVVVAQDLTPSERVVTEYKRLAEDAGCLNAELRSHIQEPSRTRDGLSIRLMGNAALLSDIPRILEGEGRFLRVRKENDPAGKPQRSFSRGSLPSCYSSGPKQRS